jgi:hypothetical protein
MGEELKPKLRAHKMEPILIFPIIFFVVLYTAFAQELILDTKYEYSIPRDEDELNGVFFKKLHSIALDKAGHVYLIDFLQSDILEFDNTGIFTRHIGRKGQGPGEYQSPQHLCFMKNGDLLLYEFGNGRFQILDSNGIYKSSFKALKYYDRVGLWNDGIYATLRPPDSKAQQIELMDFRGNIIRSFGREERLEVPKYFDVNNKLLAISETGKVFLGWDFFPWVNIFESDGRILKKIELLLPRYQQKFKQNWKTANSNIQEPLYTQIISDMHATGDEIWTLSMGGGHFIHAFSAEGKHLRSYRFKPQAEKTSYSSFEFGHTAAGLVFYLARNFPECGVDVLSLPFSK